MAQNRGKQFEEVIRKAFEKVPNVSIDRLHDQTTGFVGSQNICDFIVYKEPYEYYIECKSVHGNTLPFSNITDTQWNGLIEKSCIEGVFAGIICWWIDKDVTKFIPINVLWDMRNDGHKSIRYNYEHPDFLCSIDEETGDVYDNIVTLRGKKKRVFFEYDMEEFLSEIQFNR